MSHRGSAPQPPPQVTIRVSGKLFLRHLEYLEQLVQSAAECQLWPVLNLSQLEELDHHALAYLVRGENLRFGIASCPNFVRDQIDHGQGREAA